MYNFQNSNSKKIQCNLFHKKMSFHKVSIKVKFASYFQVHLDSYALKFE